MASPKERSFFAGGGGGGEVAASAARTLSGSGACGGSGAARTETNLAGRGALVLCLRLNPLAVVILFATVMEAIVFCFFVFCLKKSFRTCSTRCPEVVPM